MRTLRVSIVVCGLLATRIVAAQGDPKEGAAKPAPAEAAVQMDNVATGQAAPTPTPTATPSPSPSQEAPPPSNRSASGGGAAGSSDWKFDFHGYFRI